MMNQLIKFIFFSFLFFFSRKEAEELKLEVAKWRVAESAAREKLLAITQLNQSLAVSNTQSSSRTTTLSPPPVKNLSFSFKIIFDFIFSIDQ